MGNNAGPTATPGHGQRASPGLGGYQNDRGGNVILDEAVGAGYFHGHPMVDKAVGAGCLCESPHRE